ncbi:uncharacterized protein LOC132258552 [Phlebotomus argentipes]|uniref:uncharacterized protein LOC132258552 n=1 Tax=Phlebotomus argentipes TaxID=94469 RepID=UPI0028933FFA|nr:uncharacterized protein LOC132258552 [Phlebotomus argentipes]
MSSTLKKCLQEISQKEEGLLGIVLEILTSKRLLVDHQEILEDVIQSPQCKPVNSHCFTFKKSMGIFLGSLGLTEMLKAAQIQSKLILLPPIFASGYCLLSSVKEYRDLKNQGKVSKIKKFIEDLNGFDAFLRRQMVFLKEMSLFRSKIKCSDEWEANLTARTIKSVREVTQLLYRNTQYLEQKFEIPVKYQGIYQSLDKLENCDYFQKTEEDFEVKHIKEFFNIFLYIQSQFLLKIALTMTFFENGFSACERKMSQIQVKIQQELKENSENLDYFLQPPSAEVTRFTATDCQDIRGQMRQFNCLKSASGAIVTKLLTLVTQLRLFDGDLQRVRAKDEKSLQKELAKMKEAFEALSVSFTCINLEFENLHLIYNKILNLPSNAIEDYQMLVPEQQQSRKIEDLSVIPATDEFFHLDTSKDQEWEKEEADFDLANYEYDRVNQKLIKSSFKPVLVQLRKRIHPLHDAMKKRERQFMKSRGVTLAEESDGEFSDSLDEKSNDSLSDDEAQRPAKPGKYEENREFLQEKQQVGLFFSLPPPQNLLSEDVLE